MPLPAPVARRPAHQRRIAFEGFLREDGLWDFDCELIDTKPHPVDMNERGQLAPDEPIHHLKVRLTVDDTMTIRDVQAAPDAAPFQACAQAADEPMRKLVGLTVGPGWRKAIEGAIGGTAGCTHLRELVFNAATAMFQTIPYHQERRRQAAGEPRPDPGQPPFYMGKCMSWAFDGPAVLKYAPQFYRGKK